jgi:serine/tyrosine/threonine adenylyltransferase
VTTALFRFDDSYARQLPGLSVPWAAAPVDAPELLVLNEALAVELDAGPAALRERPGVLLLVGQAGAATVAHAYAGHQFGVYVPRLGDGRALLLGEVTDIHGHRRDLHLKGSGRTPFARGGRRQGRGGPDAARVPDR